MPRLIFFLMLVTGLVMAGCASQPGSGSGSTASSDLQVTLQPAPEGASGDHVTVRLADASGQALTGASVSLEGNMNHAGMVPVITDPVADDADGSADGVYQVPFSFTMQGDWIITVSVHMPNGSTVKKDVNVTVTQDGVTVKP
jgi:hypothetical protein